MTDAQTTSPPASLAQLSSRLVDDVRDLDRELGEVDLLVEQAKTEAARHIARSSAAADKPGSRNLIGIKDPGIDALIEKVIYAKDRAGVIAATKALDRVLLAHDYVVPQWSASEQRTLRWNRFSHPSVLPRYAGSGFPTTWWYDEARAAKTGAPR